MSTPLADIQTVANELANAFLTLERIQVALMSKPPADVVGVMGDAYLLALGNLWKDKPDVDAGRFATLVNKYKDMLYASQ